MLRKSLAVIGLLSAMTLASPAGALSFDGEFLDRVRSWYDSSVDLRSVEASAMMQSWSNWDRDLVPWNAPSDQPRQFPPRSPSSRVHPFTGQNWGCSNIAGRHCGPRPGSAIPEPGAALVFGAGALLVGRRLRSR